MSVQREESGGSLLDRLRAPGSCLLGTWVKIPALETVELLARAGFDFVVVDQEHSPMTSESTYRAVVVAQGLGMAVLVRVPDRSGSYLQRLLDSGVDGILVPQVADAAEAEQVVSQMVFAPRGRRGMGITSRAGTWGLKPAADYIRHGNESVVRAVQLEDRSALEQVEAILGISGLNAAFLGMGDLTLSSGLAADDPVLQELVDRFLSAAAARGLPVGTAVQTPSAAGAAADRGFSFVMVSNDANIFGSAAADLAGAARTEMGSA